VVCGHLVVQDGPSMILNYPTDVAIDAAGNLFIM
jgi:hypothetical protein